MSYPKNNKYFQGIYTPINSTKYQGNTNPAYRSSLERKFFYYFDTSPNVVAWASESIIVPYFNNVDNKIHKYYVDLIAAIKDKDGKVQKYLIELKPYIQTLPPIKSDKKKTGTVLYENLMYHQNQCKWKAASEYAAKKDMKFIILTERDLNLH